MLFSLRPATCCVGVLTLSTGVASGDAPARLVIEMVGFRNADGQAAVSVFNSAVGFPSDSSKAFVRDLAVIHGSTARVEFPSLPKGRYAIAVLHDENKNEKMDTNWIGIPTEGYGASNGARGTLGPPKFEDAVLDVSGNRVVTIKLGY